MLQNRIVSCDICGTEQTELRMGVGWPEWAIIQGIGTRPPIPGESIQNLHIEMYICPSCKEKVSTAISKIQKEEQV